MSNSGLVLVLRTAISASLCATLLLTATALAGEQSPFRLEYRAPDQCPPAAEFARRVLERSERGRLVSGPVLARTMMVTIQGEPGRLVGQLRFRDLNSDLVERELRAVTCPELVDALVLVTALAIDAQIPAEPEPEVGLPQEYLVPDTAPAAPAPAELVASPRPVGVQSDREGPWRWLAGAHATINNASSPGLAHGGKLFVSSRHHHADVSGRLGLSYMASGELQTRGEAARLDLLALVVDLCPTSVAVGPLRGMPCAASWSGGLRGTGRRSDVITHPQTTWRPWVTLGALIRLQLDLHRRLVFEVEEEAYVLLARPEFSFRQPDIPVYQPRWFGLAISLGLGLRLD